MTERKYLTMSYRAIHPVRWDDQQRLEVEEKIYSVTLSFDSNLVEIDRDAEENVFANRLVDLAWKELVLRARYSDYAYWADMDMADATAVWS